MIYENNDILRGMLQRGGKVYGPANLEARQFLFDTGEFERMRADVQFQHPRLSSEEGTARAAFRLLTSGAPPEVAAHVPTWQERARQTAARWARQAWPWMKIAWAIVVLLCAVTVLLLAAPAHSEPRPEQMRVIHRAADGALFAPQQPDGLIVQFRNQGSVLATRPAGLLTFDCSTNMSCSFSGSTFTLTSSASAGSSFDLITTGTNTSATITVDTGGTLTFSGTGNVNARKIDGVEFSNGEALGKIPIGQGDGTAVWADPLVQGVTAHDDPGTTTNPVLVGGYAWAAAPTDVTLDGDAVRAWFLRNGSQVFNLASGGSLITQGQKSMSASLPVVLASDQSAVSVTGSLTDAELRASAVTVDGSGVTQPVSAASLPLPTGASTSANQSTEITSLQKLDNVAHAGSDVALSEHVPISGQFYDVATTGVTENQVAPARITSARALHVAQQGTVTVTGPLTDAQLRASAVPVDGSGVTQPVSGTVTANAGTGNFTVVQPTGSNLHVECDAGCGGGTQYAEDTVAAAGEQLTMTGVVRQDTPSSLVDTDGDRTELSVDASGRMWVSSSGVTQPMSGTITADAGTGPWPVTDNGGSLSVDWAGTVPPIGAGTEAAALRVTMASDSTGVISVDDNGGALTVDGSVDIGTFPDNEPFDVAQIGGNTVLTGNGVTGTGSQRVTVASDNSAVAGFGVGATGSTVPTNASYQGGSGASGNLIGYLNCDNTAVYDASTNGSTQLVALTASEIIYVCGYQFSQSTATAVSVNLRYGTGTDCATSPVNITPSYPLQAASSVGPIGLVVMTPGFTGLKTAASSALCINTNAAVSVQAIVWYAKF